MPRRRSKTCRPFVLLARHRRADAVLALKQRIRQTAAEYGGCFTSHLVLNEPERPELYQQWFDFYFVGPDRFSLWNAEIITARRAFWDAVHDLAWQRAYALLTPAQQQLELLRCATKANQNSGFAAVPRYAQFGGLSLCEYLEQLEMLILHNEPPCIYESFKLDRCYRYGIGLTIIVAQESINQFHIEAAIERFLQLGATDWSAAEAVARQLLPYTSEQAAIRNAALRQT